MLGEDFKGELDCITDRDAFDLLIKTVLVTETNLLVTRGFHKLRSSFVLDGWFLGYGPLHFYVSPSEESSRSVLQRWEREGLQRIVDEESCGLHILYYYDPQYPIKGVMPPRVREP
ncbi:hypothetical protein J4410_04880 [Candidatus Woesearchaeota archaeon]|nr:hypothetical protein [Candidatus Woesearchaeota archaeon]